MAVDLEKEPLKTSYDTVKNFLTKAENSMAEFVELLEAIHKGRKGSSSRYYEPLKELAFLEDRERLAVLSQVLDDLSIDISQQGFLPLPQKVASFILDLIQPIFEGGNALFWSQAPISNLLGELKIRNSNIKSEKVSSERRFNELDEKFLKACNLTDTDVRTENFLHNSYKNYDLTFSNLQFIKEDNLDADEHSLDFTKKEQAKYQGITNKIDMPAASLLKSIKSTKNGGISVNIVINTLLFSERYVNLRNYLRNEFQIMGIVELPKVKAFSNISPHYSLMILRNNNEQRPDEVFLSDLRDNFSEREKVINDWKEFLVNEPAYKDL